MRRPVTVACVQAEPVVLDREATLDRLAARTAEAARRRRASSSSSPRPSCPPTRRPSGRQALAGWAEPGAKAAFALLARESVELPGPAADRLGEVAREHGVWLVTGVTEIDPERPGTLYNTLLYHDPEGGLALHHRKLVPTNHERLVWGPGDGRGLRAIPTELGRLGGLICWENYMPLARFSLYESGVEIYIASTADDSDAWQATLVHIARESRAFVVAPSHFQRAAAYPADFPLRHLLEDHEVIGRGGSAILGPDGAYLAGPLYDEEGILVRRARSRSPGGGAAALRPGRPLPPPGRLQAARARIGRACASGATLRGPVWARYFDEQTETMPAAWTRRLEEDLLAEQVTRCFERAPFYSRKLTAAGIRPEHVETLEDLQLLPFTTRDELRAAQTAAPPFGDFVCADQLDIARVHVSSDTTGRPLLVGFTEDDLRASAEIGARALWACGARPDDVVLQCVSEGYPRGPSPSRRRSRPREQRPSRWASRTLRACSASGRTSSPQRSPARPRSRSRWRNPRARRGWSRAPSECGSC